MILGLFRYEKYLIAGLLMLAWYASYTYIDLATLDLIEAKSLLYRNTPKPPLPKPQLST